MTRFTEKCGVNKGRFWLRFQCFLFTSNLTLISARSSCKPSLCCVNSSLNKLVCYKHLIILPKSGFKYFWVCKGCSCKWQRLIFILQNVVWCKVIMQGMLIGVAYTLRTSSLWAEFVNKNRCVSVCLVSEEAKSI